MKLSQYPISRPSSPRQPLRRGRRTRQGAHVAALAGTALLLAGGGVALADPVEAAGMSG